MFGRKSIRNRSCLLAWFIQPLLSRSDSTAAGSHQATRDGDHRWDSALRHTPGDRGPRALWPGPASPWICDPIHEDVVAVLIHKFIQAQQWHKLIVIDPISSEFPHSITSSVTARSSLPCPNSNQSQVRSAIWRAKWWYLPVSWVYTTNTLGCSCLIFCRRGAWGGLELANKQMTATQCL